MFMGALCFHGQGRLRWLRAACDPFEAQRLRRSYVDCRRHRPPPSALELSISVDAFRTARPVAGRGERGCCRPASIAPNDSLSERCARDSDDARSRRALSPHRVEADEPDARRAEHPTPPERKGSGSRGDPFRRNNRASITAPGRAGRPASLERETGVEPATSTLARGCSPSGHYATLADEGLTKRPQASRSVRGHPLNSL